MKRETRNKGKKERKKKSLQKPLPIALVGGIVGVGVPREEALDYVIKTLEKMKAEVRQADRSTYSIEGKSASAITGVSFPFQIKLKPYLKTNTLVEVLAPLDKHFVNSFMREFAKIRKAIREPVVIDLVTLEKT
jgi:hypothetical protein